MERTARASFRVIHVNRWSLAAMLLLGLGLLLWPARGLLPVSGGTEPHVPAGVTMLGRDLGGRSAAELESLLTDWARLLGSAPVPAHAARRATGELYVVPELNGYRLDVAQTAARALGAQPGGVIAPVWVEVPAAVTAGREYGHLPIYSANPGKPAVALIINVAWGEQHLPAMLDTLTQHQARATFLITGRWATRHPDLVQVIARAGHEVGNHGFNDNSSPADLARKGEIKGDIQKADEALRGILGVQPRYYQPHMGEVNTAIIKAARDLGYTTVLWSLDTIDWREDATVEKVRSRVLSQVKSGDLILLHPTEVARQALPDILKGLRDKRLQTMTLTEILSPSPQAPANVH